MVRDCDLQDAFNQVCSEAKTPQGYYVSLMLRTQRYGGPEEGGWWIDDSHIMGYQYYATEEAAQAAKEAVEKLAAEKTEEARKSHGERCLREMDFLDDRMLEADFLPEPDGPSEYYVTMTEGLPEEYRGPTHYE